jgi:hypothetical protein
MSPEEQQAWLRSSLDAAVSRLTELAIFNTTFIEVRPAWAAPGHFLIGKAREPDNDSAFRWFIAAESGVLDHLADTAAATPREAARHFALKWQLDASRLGETVAADLIGNAELLYALVDDDRFWAT